MIIIKKTVEITYYLEESELEAFADHNDYDEDELIEAINNEELDLEELCAFQDETTVDYKVERD